MQTTVFQGQIAASESQRAHFHTFYSCMKHLNLNMRAARDYVNVQEDERPAMPRRRHKLAFYALYWTAYVLLFSIIQGLPANDFSTALINEVVSLPPKVIFVLVVIEVLVPLQFERLRFVAFSVSYVALMILFAFVQRVIDNYIVLQYFLQSWTVQPLLSVPPFLYNVSKLQFVVTLPLALKLFSNWNRERTRKMQVEADKVRTELELLRSQFHPHFMFNVLNNLYSKIISGSPQAPEIVIRISDMLRFGVYQSNGRISLEDEVKYLQNYVSLQQMRFDHRVEVSLSVHGNLTDAVIEPFIIQPLIENSFKHSMREANPAWITVSIEREHEWLSVRIENSLPTIAGEEQRKTGVGLAQVRKRLELLYPHSHSLKIQRRDDSFLVLLRLKVQP